MPVEPPKKEQHDPPFYEPEILTGILAASYDCAI